MSFSDLEDYSVEQIIEVIDEMARSKQPKVLLFDIGGVCVSQLSHLQVIVSQHR